MLVVDGSEYLAHRIVLGRIYFKINKNMFFFVIHYSAAFSPKYR